MQVRALSKQQFMYLKDVLGVDTVMHSAPQHIHSAKHYDQLVVVSAPLSAEEKDLLQKITSAFGWSTYQVVIATEITDRLSVATAFVFGREAKSKLDEVATVQSMLLAPSLGILLTDAQAKKTLWNQMKSFMENS